MSYLPMLAMVVTARRHRRRAIMDNLWPAMIPTTNLIQRGTIAAVTADNTVRRAERAEARAARETTAAVQLAATQPNGKLTDAQLQSLPALARLHRFAPDVRQAIDQVVADRNIAIGADLDTVTTDVAKLASALLKDKPMDITLGQLKELTPRLFQLLEGSTYIEGDKFKPIDISLPKVAIVVK